MAEAEPSAELAREANVEPVSELLPMADIVLVIDSEHDVDLDREPADETLLDEPDE